MCIIFCFLVMSLEFYHLPSTFGLTLKIGLEWCVVPDRRGDIVGLTNFNDVLIYAAFLSSDITVINWLFGHFQAFSL